MNLDRLFFAYRSWIRSWIPILPVSKTNTKTNTPQRIVRFKLFILTHHWYPSYGHKGNRESQLLGSWVVNKRQNHSDLAEDDDRQGDDLFLLIMQFSVLFTTFDIHGIPRAPDS
jgi:hypothetical protein